SSTREPGAITRLKTPRMGSRLRPAGKECWRASMNALKHECSVGEMPRVAGSASVTPRCSRVCSRHARPTDTATHPAADVAQAGVSLDAGRAGARYRLAGGAVPRG